MTMLLDADLAAISRRGFVTGALAAGVLAACGGGDADVGPSPTAPAASLDEAPAVSTRVAALDARTLDILVALHVPVVAAQPGGSALGIPDYVAERSSSPIEVVGDGGTLNLEALATTRPDLLIGTGDFASVRSSLQGIATLEVYESALFREDGQVDWRADITTVGALVGLEEQAADLVEMLALRFAQTARAIDRAQGSGIAILRSFGAEGFRLYGPGTVPSAIAADAGIELAPLPTTPDEGRFVLDLAHERIVDVTASHIFVSIGNFGDVGGEDELAMLEADPLWSRVPAVQAGNAAPIRDTAAWFIGGPLAWPVMLDEVEAYFDER